MVKFKLISIKYVRILEPYPNLKYGMVKFPRTQTICTKNYGKNISKNRRNYCPYT